MASDKQFTRILELGNDQDAVKEELEGQFHTVTHIFISALT